MTLIEAIRIAREDWEWLAIDASGGIFGYSYKPVIFQSVWFADEDDWCGLSHYDFIGQHAGTPIDWKKSLVRLTELKV